MTFQPRQVTQLLQELDGGDTSAADRLLQLVYGDLRDAAKRALRRQRAGHTLQATALVNEAYLRMVGPESPGYDGRRHFLSVASIAMRQILADYARRRDASKRGGSHKHVPLEDVDPADAEFDEVQGDDLVALDAALSKLQRIDPRQARIVELRFLGGMSYAEIAAEVGIAPSTVRLDWKMARGWLQREIDG